MKGKGEEFRELLNRINQSVLDVPIEFFFEQMDKLVEYSREQIEGIQDEEMKRVALEFYREIIRHAFECRFQWLSCQGPGFKSCVSASC
jgi:hypothetical protein